MASEGVAMLVRFKERDLDAGAVTFLDELPPFGVVQIADSTWDWLGQPSELLVRLVPTGPVSVRPLDQADADA